MESSNQFECVSNRRGHTQYKISYTSTTLLDIKAQIFRVPPQRYLSYIFSATIHRHFFVGGAAVPSFLLSNHALLPRLTSWPFDSLMNFVPPWNITRKRLKGAIDAKGYGRRGERENLTQPNEDKWGGNENNYWARLARAPLLFQSLGVACPANFYTAACSQKKHKNKK
jgi:hypothetical protein